jgi:hypothetical protein
MTTEKVAVDQSGLKKAVRRGLWGAFWLAVLTIAEFAVFTVGDGEQWLTIALLPFVALKAWIILDVFMHIGELWGDGH